MFIIKEFICLILIFKKIEITLTQLRLMGPYWLDIKEYKRCNSSIDYPIQFNLFPRITTKYSQILFGNITLKQPLDDSLSIHMLSEKYDSVGLWKENSLVNVKNACSSMKSGMFGEKSWKYFVNIFQIPTINCPLPKGHYISRGYDSATFKDSNFPKSFFYGKYSFRTHLLDNKNNLISCTIVSLEFKPFS
ncbi:uncharacterized protein LOC126904332 [Daktulosphaira vitifoliae]|uniref:uncharacterized protein LOC126904332 n=1 Tax=Daktulosphaira vitifoliae TaxID=58002 RepID=UPI0021AAE7B1|nr:uncharacterized protein LOC126904332 [Daktulosphaira vitifoliae]